MEAHDNTAPAVPATPVFNPDHDPFYLRPTAWKKVKAAFGVEHRIVTLLKQLELLTEPHDPRVHLAAAIHAYLHLNSAARGKARLAHLDWVAIEVEFEKAMSSFVGGDHGAQ